VSTDVKIRASSCSVCCVMPDGGSLQWSSGHIDPRTVSH
jgi:hypothetical protein